MKALAAYKGGKSRQASWIASHINATPHTAYVECCAGMASVFFAKSPSHLEILNDHDKQLTLIFKGLRDNQAEFIEHCRAIEHSMAAITEAKYHLRGNPDALPDWKLGAWRLFLVAQSYAGDQSTLAWGTKGQDHAKTWLLKIGSLGAYADRLQMANIVDHDIFTLLGKVNKPGVLTYIDPPYNGAEFRFRCTLDHEKLAARLKEMKCKIIVSHYYEEPYISLYEGWRVDTQATLLSCASNNGFSSPDTYPQKYEALFFNYS